MNIRTLASIALASLACTSHGMADQESYTQYDPRGTQGPGAYRIERNGITFSVSVRAYKRTRERLGLVPQPELTDRQRGCIEAQTNHLAAAMLSAPDYGVLVRDLMGVRNVRVELVDNRYKAVRDKVLSFGPDARRRGTLVLRAVLNSKGDCFASDAWTLQDVFEKWLALYQASLGARPGAKVIELILGEKPDLAQDKIIEDGGVPEPGPATNELIEIRAAGSVPGVVRAPR